MTYEICFDFQTIHRKRSILNTYVFRKALISLLQFRISNAYEMFAFSRFHLIPSISNNLHDSLATLMLISSRFSKAHESFSMKPKKFLSLSASRIKTFILKSWRAHLVITIKKLCTPLESGFFSGA